MNVSSARQKPLQAKWNNKVKIGIISDTHTKVKKASRAIDALISDGAEFLVHAGDIVEVETLELLKKSSLRYEAVYGNNDAHLARFHDKYNLVQEPYYFKISDTTFKLMHLPFYMTPDTDIVIFGHTHTFHSEYNGSTLFLNPGEVCARNKNISEWAMLEIKDDELIVTAYTRENKSDTIEKEEFSYTRETK